MARMSAASRGSFSSLRCRPRAAKSSRQRIPFRCSCNPFSTVSRPQPNRRSAWRAQPPQSAVATSAWNKRRWYPVSRRAPDRIKASYCSEETSIAVALPEVRRSTDRPGSTRLPNGQDNSILGKFLPSGRLDVRERLLEAPPHLGRAADPPPGGEHLVDQ